MTEEERDILEGEERVTITKEEFNIDQLCNLCHKRARENHWWDQKRNVGEMIALIHSEISEAMEGYRKDAMDEHLPHLPSVAVELADALVRIFDMAGGLNLPLGRAFAEKVEYNRIRADHKLAARRAPGGKSF